MRFFRRLAGLLGFAKDELHLVNDEEESDDADVNRVESHLPRKGFIVPVKVTANRAQVGPILAPCSTGDGGVQGFRWHAKRLRIDEDGDVADEFFDEVLPETLFKDHKPSPRFQLKYSTTPAKVKNQVLSLQGQLQQCVEHRGRLQWL